MYITSAGMICSVGLNAESACAAMRAGISNFKELPYVDNHGEAIVGSIVPSLDSKLKREERIIELLSHSIVNCIEHVNGFPFDNVPIIIGLSEPDRSGGSATVSSRVIHEIQERFDVRFHPQHSHILMKGHTAGFIGLKIARELMKNYNVPACLLCGVDSYINASSLNWLNKHWRLKTTDNSDGIIPGEGSASVLLQRELRSRSDTVVRVAGIGFGHSKSNAISDEPQMGIGLTEATINALKEAKLKMHDIGLRLSDIAGEAYGFKEQTLVICKLLRVHQDEGFPIWHCAEYIGDAGAAAGIIQLVVAFYSYKNRYAPNEASICFASSDSGRRAVTVISSVKLPSMFR